MSKFNQCEQLYLDEVDDFIKALAEASGALAVAEANVPGLVAQAASSSSYLPNRSTPGSVQTLEVQRAQ